MTREHAYRVLTAALPRYRQLLAVAGAEVPDAIDEALYTLRMCIAAETGTDPATRAPLPPDRAAIYARLGEALRAFS